MRLTLVYTRDGVSRCRLLTLQILRFFGAERDILLDFTLTTAPSSVRDAQKFHAANQEKHVQETDFAQKKHA